MRPARKLSVQVFGLVRGVGQSLYHRPSKAGSVGSGIGDSGSPIGCRITCRYLVDKLAGCRRDRPLNAATIFAIVLSR
jgi:hypothetical protein